MFLSCLRVAASKSSPVQGSKLVPWALALHISMPTFELLTREGMRVFDCWSKGSKKAKKVTAGSKARLVDASRISCVCCFFSALALQAVTRTGEVEKKRLNKLRVIWT